MAGDLYDQDFIGWTEEQARLLREAAARAINLPLDWEHLAEEVEDLGKNRRDAVASQLVRIIEHLLKLEFSPATDPRAGWIDTVDDARAQIELLLDSDPGLKPRLPEMLARAAPIAVKRAVKGLARHGEDAAAGHVRLRGPGHYSLDQIVGDWLPERPDLPALQRA